MKAILRDHMGDDLTVVNSARVSFDKKSDWEIEPCGCGEIKSHYGYPCTTGACNYREVLAERDVKLINFLARHGHWTPFAHPQISLEMSAPVPIRTQCFKHKQGFVENEESRRYIKSRPKLFTPDEIREAPENAKQGSGGVHEHSLLWRGVYKDYCNDMIDLYEQMIEDGVAPEQARLILPQGVEVSWIWTGSLAAFARVVRQRKDSHAQKEIQQLALKIDEIIRPLFPVSWEALTNE